jgi:hypothetical protein
LSYFSCTCLPAAKLRAAWQEVKNKHGLHGLRARITRKVTSPNLPADALPEAEWALRAITTPSV